MDLPERMQTKISSRIGNNRLVYEPYNKEQVKEILESRVKEIVDIFSKDSLRFVAMKIGNYSGDIRRSLMITRRAVEICREKYLTQVKSNKRDPKQLLKVEAGFVNEAFNELYTSKTVKVLQQLCTDEVLTIIALFLELQSNKIEKALIDKVQDRMNSLRVHLNNRCEIKTSMFREIVKRMQAIGLISMEIMS